MSRCLIFISRNSTRTQWQNYEIGGALASAESQGHRVVPVLLPGASQEDIPALLSSIKPIDVREIDLTEAATEMAEHVKSLVSTVDQEIGS